MTHFRCAARQYSDQMVCRRCDLVWDTNDGDRPRCNPQTVEPADASFLNGGPATEPGLSDDDYPFTADVPPRRSTDGWAPRLGGDGYADIPPRLIAFAGEKGAGKDTAAAVLIEAGWVNVKMADGLKAMLRALLAFRGCPAPEIERMLEGDLKETPTRHLSGRTPRHAMASLGTDWARKLMHEDFWVDTTDDRLNRLPRAVITDVRFHNEAALVERRGGRLYFIDRHNHGGCDDHASETEVRTIKADGVIHNDFDTAADLQAETRRRLVADGLLT